MQQPMFLLKLKPSHATFFPQILLDHISLNKYLLSAYSVSGSVSGVWNNPISNSKISDFTELIFYQEETDKKTKIINTLHNTLEVVSAMGKEVEQGKGIGIGVGRCKSYYLR